MEVILFYIYNTIVEIAKLYYSSLSSICIHLSILMNQYCFSAAQERTVASQEGALDYLATSAALQQFKQVWWVVRALVKT